MVRLLSVLAILVATLCVVAPAHASGLPVALDGVSATAQTTVEQVTASAQPALRQTVKTAATAARPAAPGAEPAIRDAAGVAEPAVDSAIRVAAAPVAQAQADRAAPDAAAAAHGQTPGRSARSLSATPDRIPPRPMAEQGAVIEASGSQYAGAPPQPAAPGARDGAPGSERGPSAGGGAPASPAPSGFYLFGGLALLTWVLALAWPRLLRRLQIRLAARRPAAFVALLERPG